MDPCRRPRTSDTGPLVLRSWIQMRALSSQTDLWWIYLCSWAYRPTVSLIKKCPTYLAADTL